MRWECFQVGFDIEFRDQNTHNEISLILEMMSIEARDPIFKVNFSNFYIELYNCYIE